MSDGLPSTVDDLLPMFRPARRAKPTESERLRTADDHLQDTITLFNAVDSLNKTGAMFQESPSVAGFRAWIHDIRQLKSLMEILEIDAETRGILKNTVPSMILAVGSSVDRQIAEMKAAS